MKYIFFLIVVLYSMGSYSQTPAEQLANNLADRFKDSLALTSQQRGLLYDVNISLHNQKQAVRAQYQQPDSLRFHFQRIENTRDSLYRPIIGEEKYILYKEKKRFLLSGQ